MDASHSEREWKKGLITFKDNQVKEKREKMQSRAERQAAKEAMLASLEQIKCAGDVTIDMTVKALDNQLDLYRKLVPNIPLKSRLKTKALKIEALKEAIRLFQAEDIVSGDIGSAEE
jgi:hypothetical protein